MPARPERARPPQPQSQLPDDDAYNDHIGSVMDFHEPRSTSVSATFTVPAQGSSWERFEALYRSSRDDVFAYVATLLRDRSAAEDITALAFERAYRRRRTFDRRRGEER